MARKIRLKDARSLLNQIATGRTTDPEAIRRAARMVVISLPDRDEWDAPASVPKGPQMRDGMPYWPDVDAGETVEAPGVQPMIEDAKPKKKGGRPKGSKNKPRAAIAPPDPGGVL